MRYGLIKNGVCVAVTETGEFSEAQRRAVVHGCMAVKLPDGYGVGSTFEKNTWENPLPEPEPEPEMDGSVWDELDAAYTAGYAEGYQEGVNTAYDQ